MIWWLVALGLGITAAVIWARGAGRACWVYVIPSRSSLRHPAYVGHGYDPDARLDSHRRKYWAYDIDESRPMRREKHPNKRIAHKRERELIRRLDPLHNEIKYITVK
jgi:predicted GIY-YIG superfamily endonuclease